MAHKVVGRQSEVVISQCVFVYLVFCKGRCLLNSVRDVSFFRYKVNCGPECKGRDLLGKRRGKRTLIFSTQPRMGSYSTLKLDRSKFNGFISSG